MSTTPQWLYDELKQLGTDYEDIAVVREYEERMSKFRDFTAETETIIEACKINSAHTLLEVGTGTGWFVRNISPLCKEVVAIDVSQVMLDYAAKKAEEEGCQNIIFQKNGFLTHDYPMEHFDIIVSQLTLHHIPDMWKLIALHKLNEILKTGGYLYLKDLVFSMQIEKYEKTLDYSIKAMRESAGDETADNLINHIRDEHSTYDWILEEMLYRAGFDLIDAQYDEHSIATYVCRKR